MPAFVPAALLAAVLLAGCGSSAPPVEAGGERVAPGAVPVRADDPLDFGLATLDGRAFDGEDLRGAPALLWFWAPWCVVCRAEAPEVARIAAETPGLTVVGVAGRGQEAAMRDFVDDTGTGDLVHLVDSDGAVWTRFGVIGQPAYAFVDADGRAQVVNGALGTAALEEAVATLASG